MTMDLKRYENTICSVDTSIFKEDEYTFCVLERILQDKCALTITDYSRLIVCQSCSPFPVWVWLPDDATGKEMERAWRVIKENFTLDGEYGFNVKPFLAEYIIKRFKEEGMNWGITQNLLAYRCLEPILPAKPADGYCEIAGMEELELAVECMHCFHEDADIDKQDRERYREKAQLLIEEKKLFFWINGEGEKIATCSYHIEGNKARISYVYTRKDKRRMGYAAQMVYDVTQRIKKQGKIPTLYTDADYAASNACYMGIGYKQQGSLCTVGKL